MPTWYRTAWHTYMDLLIRGRRYLQGNSLNVQSSVEGSIVAGSGLTRLICDFQCTSCHHAIQKTNYSSPLIHTVILQSEKPKIETLLLKEKRIMS